MAESCGLLDNAMLECIGPPFMRWFFGMVVISWFLGYLITKWTSKCLGDKARGQARSHCEHLKSRISEIEQIKDPSEAEKLWLGKAKNRVMDWHVENDDNEDVSLYKRNKQQAVWMGLIERTLFAGLVAIWAPGWAVAVVAFAALKSGTGFNHIAYKESSEDLIELEGKLAGRWIAFASTMTSLVSVIVAVFGGLVCRGFSIPT